MKKNFIILFLIIINFSITNANDYKCTSHDLYNVSIYNMTDNDDTYKCENYWMQGNIINTKGGNDKVYISKNTGSDKLKINMGDGNDNFYHTYHDVQLVGTIIDGGNGNDTMNILNDNANEYKITGDCSNSCTISRIENSYLFKDVTLISIENIVFNDKTITNTSIQEQTTIHPSTYPKIDLSSYKTIIPAYWWSYELNKKLLNFKNKSAIIIINPGNGDFNKTENIFVDQINKTIENNNLAIGYIYSLYGKRNLNTVKEKIDNRLKYYPNIGGIFIDEVSTSKSDYEFYKKIYNYIKTKNSDLVVVINPGTNPDESYTNISDNIVIYENPCKEFTNHKISNWVNKYNKDKFSFLGYKCNKSEFNNVPSKYKNYINYFTEDGQDGNPWDSLSSLGNTKKDIINNTSNTNTLTNNTSYSFSPKNKFNTFLVYYGYPNYINEAQDIHLSDKKEELKERLQVAVKEFSKFKTIIWSSRLPNPSHKAHKPTKELLKLLKGNVISYGYIALYGGYRGKATPESVCRDVDEWSTMGVDGIFFDEASFNYYKKSNNNFKDYQNYIKTVYKCAKKYGYKVIFNTGNSKDIINTIPNLTENDGFMIEDFYYANGDKKQSYIDRVNRNKAVINKTNAKYFCLATGKGLSNQGEVNKIGKELKNEIMSTCDYRSVQDATYGTESKITYASDDILNGNEIFKNHTKKINNNKTSNKGKEKIVNNISNNNINSKTNNKISNQIDDKINIFLKKLKNNSTKAGYRKKLIILVGNIKKIKNKYKNNDIILILIDYLDQRIRNEISKIK